MVISLRRYLPITLICITLAALLVSSFQMIGFEQSREGMSSGDTVYEYYVREAGYGRLTIATVGLFVLLVPFRKGQLWAWIALTFAFVAYFLPTFVIPYLTGWHVFYLGMLKPGLPRLAFFNIFFSGLMLIGLAMSSFEFLRRQKSVEGID